MDTRSLGLLIAVGGVAVVVIGLLVATGALGWFGRLPGDLRYEGENVRVYAPIASMVIASVALTLLLAVLRRFL